MHVLNIQIQCNQQHDLEKEKNEKKQNKKTKKASLNYFTIIFYFVN